MEAPARSLRAGLRPAMTKRFEGPLRAVAGKHIFSKGNHA